MHAPRFSLAALGVLALCAAAQAQPTLTGVSPGAVAPGKTIDLKLNGTKLDDPLVVWASFPAKFELLPHADPQKPVLTQRTCRVTVDPSVGVGFGGLIVANKEGASDLLLLMIDDLPSLAEISGNQSSAKAQDVTLPAAVDAASNGGAFDYFRFQAAAGQRVAVELVAGRLSQNFDPVVRLLDAEGRTLLQIDDDPSLGSDCRFSYTFPQAGQYVLEVRDNQYRANGAYRLRIGDFPLVTSVYPLGARPGAATRLTFLGPDVGAAAPFDFTPPAAEFGGLRSIGVKTPGGVSSGMATIAVDDKPEAVELEPNDTPDKATPITAPGAVSGRLEAAKDRDYFRFTAKKGGRLAIKAGARSFGSPAFVRIFAHKADGVQIAESAVTDADEETLLFVPPADGDYLVSVEDLLKRGGPEFAYRLSLEPVPSFTMAMKADRKGKYKFAIAKNGALTLDVPVARNGYDGPIMLSLAGVRDGYQLFGNMIGEKLATTKLIILPPPDAQPGDFAPARIVGTATIDGVETTATLRTADQVRQLRPALGNPPDWYDGLVSLSITAETKPLFATSLEPAKLTAAAKSEKVEFTLALERLEKDFKDPLLVLVNQLPAGATYEVKREGNGPKEQYKVTVKFAKGGAVAGASQLRIVGYGELKTQTQAIAASLPLEIAAE